jgi:hypothetical protein
VRASWHLFVSKNPVDEELTFLVFLTLENEPLASHWVISQKIETDVKTWLLHCYHHAPTVKPEAATAVVELLMKGVRTPETC